MTLAPKSRPKLAAIAAACLLTVALPSTAAMAAKTKTPPAETTTQTTGVTAPPKFSVEVADIDAVDSNVDDETLRSIFAGDVVDNADALAGLTATSITVPDITVSFSSTIDGKPQSGELTLTDLVLDDVEDGVAASVSLGGIELSSNQNVSGSFGTISAANFDIGGMLGLYGLVEASDSTAFSPIYSDFAAEGGSMQIEQVACNIGPVSVAEFKARPLKTNFAEMMALSQSLEASGEAEQPSPEVIGKVLRMYADIFTAFESSPVVYGGFDCKGTDDTGTPLDFAIAGMTMDGLKPGFYPSITMDGFRMTVPDAGDISIGSLGFKAMDLSGPIAALENAPVAIDQAWLESNVRALIPAFAGFSIADFKMDFANPEAAGTRIKASIGAFDLSLADYFNGIPTSLSTTGSKIMYDLPADSGDEQINQLIALGIKSVDFGFGIKAAWDQAANAINIEDISIDGVDLARIGLSGTIGNATQALFDENADTSLAAAMAVVIKNLKVDVVDAGLSDIVLAAVSATQGADAATMRPIYAGLAEGTIIGMLAGAAEAQKVGKAVNAFITGDAKALTIEMTAKDPAGLGLADFMAAEDNPTVLIGKTNITATAK
ncbi:MAG: hypothetical protein ACOH2M_09300 [Cypionkella sp.]